MHWLCGTCQRQTLEAEAERAREVARAELAVLRLAFEEAAHAADAMRGTEAHDAFVDRAREAANNLLRKGEEVGRGTAPACPLCKAPVEQTLSMTLGAGRAASPAELREVLSTLLPHMF